jgi:PAS domain S-box-containing protein
MMNETPTYEALQRQVESLSQQSQKLQEAEQAIQQQNEYLSALHETALGLIDKLDTQELLQTILERAAGLAKTQHGYIYLREPGAKHMEIRVGMGFFTGQLGRRVRWGQGLGGKVWQTGKPLLVNDYRNWPDRVDDVTLEPLLCAVGIPLKVDQRIRGVIGLGQVDKQRSFDQNDVSTLARFSALALLAIEKAELYSEVRHELGERRKAEARIRESEHRYRNFLESSPDPIVVYNMEGVATYVNPAFEQTFSMSRKELLGKQIDFVPPETWPETRAAIQTMLSGKKINLFETQRLTKDGRKLDVQISSCLYMNEEGEHAGNIVTLRDITDRKRAERALQNYQDQLEELVQERTAELAMEVEERRRAEKTLTPQGNRARSPEPAPGRGQYGAAGAPEAAQRGQERIAGQCAQQRQGAGRTLSGPTQEKSPEHPAANAAAHPGIKSQQHRLAFSQPPFDAILKPYPNGNPGDQPDQRGQNQQGNRRTAPHLEKYGAVSPAQHSGKAQSEKYQN